MKNCLKKTFFVLCALLGLMALQNIANARTMVVQISSFDPTESVHGLLFALHSLRDSRGEFGNDPYDLTVKVLFNGEGVLNASNKIKHPIITFKTRPEDPKKSAAKLIRKLQKEGVEMRATGFGLKQHGLDPMTDLLPGVKGGGADIIPRFVTSPDEDDGVIVVSF